MKKTVFCPHCGRRHPLVAGMKYCGHCGHRFSSRTLRRFNRRLAEA